MPMTQTEICRALFKAKMSKYLKERNMTLGDFFNQTGFTQNRYHRLIKGQDLYFSTIVEFIACTNGHFTYDEMANLLEK